MSQLVMGRAERVDLPAYHLNDLPAKVDTGAYSSSIDCEKAEVIVKDNQKVVQFVLLRPGRPGYTGHVLTTQDFAHTQVTNSNGQQDRIVIFTDMIINGQTHGGRFTLTDRSKLRYPVLIGRKFIREAGYMVDVTQGHGLPGDEEERNL